MKSRWVWTSKGWLLTLIIVGLIVVGTTFVKSGIARDVILGLVLFLMVVGYGRTFLHIRKHNREVEEVEKERLREQDEVTNREIREFLGGRREKSI